MTLHQNILKAVADYALDAHESGRIEERERIIQKIDNFTEEYRKFAINPITEMAVHNYEAVALMIIALINDEVDQYVTNAIKLLREKAE